MVYGIDVYQRTCSTLIDVFQLVRICMVISVSLPGGVIVAINNFSVV